MRYSTLMSGGDQDEAIDSIVSFMPHQIEGLAVLWMDPIKTRIAFYEALSGLDPDSYRRLEWAYATRMVVDLESDTAEETKVRIKVAENLGVDPNAFDKLPHFYLILSRILLKEDEPIMPWQEEQQRYVH